MPGMKGDGVIDRLAASFKSWTKEDILKYLQFLMHNYRVIDAFWFINIENRHGLEEACKINELVWGKVGDLAARDLKNQFNFNEKGIPGFVKALKIFPWCIIVGYGLFEKDHELIIEVPSCPAQEGRLKHGMDEYDCEEMHRAEFESFAKVIDPSIKVECLFAPTDKHPQNLYCRWRFTAEGQ
jgi:hypothetical protein